MKNTPSASDIPTRTRSIDAQTINEVAGLVARSLTESEACRLLGIKPSTWFDFKSRCSRSEKFAAALEKFRAKRIDSLVARVEKSAEGIDLKQPDFRAALALLSHIDARRYSDSGQRAQVQVNVTTPPVIPLTLIMTTLEKVYAGQVVDVEPVKALPAPVQAGPQVDGLQFVGPKPKPVKVPKLTFTTPTPAPAPAGDIARLPQKTDDIDNR